MDAPLAEDTIRNSLREVIDPEIGINIVDLGLIYEIELAPAAEDRIRHRCPRRVGHHDPDHARVSGRAAHPAAG